MLVFAEINTECRENLYLDCSFCWRLWLAVLVKCLINRQAKIWEEEFKWVMSKLKGISLSF